MESPSSRSLSALSASQSGISVKDQQCAVHELSEAVQWTLCPVSRSRYLIASSMSQLFYSTRRKGAVKLLAPMTFELYDFLEPHGSISRYRLAIHHFWTGGNLIEENPDRYTLENTYPKPLGHDWANVGCQIKFNSPAAPNVRPARHPRIQDSDLETLERRDEPPMPEEQVLPSRYIRAPLPFVNVGSEISFWARCLANWTAVWFKMIMSAIIYLQSPIRNNGLLYGTPAII